MIEVIKVSHLVKSKVAFLKSTKNAAAAEIGPFICGELRRVRVHGTPKSTEIQKKITCFGTHIF